MESFRRLSFILSFSAGKWHGLIYDEIINCGCYIKKRLEGIQERLFIEIQAGDESDLDLALAGEMEESGHALDL